MERHQAVLEFWFGKSAADYATQKPKWFKQDDSYDEEIREKFGKDLEQAIEGQLDSWAGDPKSLLALIILFDQFSRNLYRGSGKAFAQDEKSAALVQLGVEKGFDKEFDLYQKWFFYMPLMHSEKLESQDLAIKKYEELVATAPENEKSTFEGVLDYSHRHRDIIVRFGRFPHRNERVGRESTPEEIEFLKQPGSSFG